MKIEIQRDRLTQSIHDCMRAISNKTTIPILVGMKLVAERRGLTLTGSNSDISIEIFIPAEEDGDEIMRIDAEGEVVLNARLFSDIVRKLPLESVVIEVKERYQTVIRSGKSDFQINGVDPSEYPQLLQIEEKAAYSLPTDLLKTVIKQTVFAISTVENRPILTGVEWQIKKDHLYCSATDSHRLARKVIPFQSAEELSVVIPGKSLMELSRLIDDNTGSVEMFFAKNQVLFKTKNILFYSRLLEGNYPDTSRLIPQEKSTTVKINTKDFFHAVDRASLLAKEDRNNVVKFSTDGIDVVQVTSSTAEIGNVKEEVAIEEFQGEEIEISFSAPYMLDALRTIDDEETEIQFSGIMRPFLLKSMKDDTLIQLILPVRTV